MKRSLTYALVAGLLTLAFLALGGDALAKKGRELLLSEQVQVQGVQHVGSGIQIDLDLWEVEQNGDNGLTLSGKKKKKKKDKTEDVGLTCKCSSGSGACSISRQGKNATCNGGSCCGWVVIAGEELGDDVKVITP
jgi:hypothetical protein